MNTKWISNWLWTHPPSSEFHIFFFFIYSEDILILFNTSKNIPFQYVLSYRTNVALCSLCILSTIMYNLLSCYCILSDRCKILLKVLYVTCMKRCGCLFYVFASVYCFIRVVNNVVPNTLTHCRFNVCPPSATLAQH